VTNHARLNTFAEDCCDREIVSFRAWEGIGPRSEPVHVMVVEAMDKLFGATETVLAGHGLESLSDNGSSHIAGKTRHCARALRLTPLNTPVRSPLRVRELRQSLQARRR
jgi:putative transposase